MLALDLRKIIALAARTPNKRKVSSPKQGRPHKWEPEKVNNPKTGFPFTSFGAWEYIADRLEDEIPITEIALKHPKGKMAYVMTIPLRERTGNIYIKFEFVNNFIIGRSFHY